MPSDLAALAKLAGDLTALVERLERELAGRQGISSPAAHEVHELRMRAEQLLEPVS